MGTGTVKVIGVGEVRDRKRRVRDRWCTVATSSEGTWG